MPTQPSAPKPGEGTHLPDEVFHVFAGLFPDLLRIIESADLNAVEFFTLWYLKYQGDAGDDDEWVVMRYEVTELFAKEVLYTDQKVDQHLKRLERKNLINRRRMTAAERSRKVRGVDEGALVALLPEGVARLERVKQGISQLFEETIAGVPSPIRLPFMKVAFPAIAKVAKTLLEHQRARVEKA